MRRGPAPDGRASGPGEIYVVGFPKPSERTARPAPASTERFISEYFLDSVIPSAPAATAARTAAPSPAAVAHGHLHRIHNARERGHARSGAVELIDDRTELELAYNYSTSRTRSVGGFERGIARLTLVRRFGSRR